MLSDGTISGGVGSPGLVKKFSEKQETFLKYVKIMNNGNLALEISEDPRLCDFWLVRRMFSKKLLTDPVAKTWNHVDTTNFIKMIMLSA